MNNMGAWTGEPANGRVIEDISAAIDQVYMDSEWGYSEELEKLTGGEPISWDYSTLANGNEMLTIDCVDRVVVIEFSEVMKP